VDASEVAPGLFVASQFYPRDEWDAVFIDTSAVLTDDDIDQTETLEAIAQAVKLLHDVGYDVVVECQAGRNRSAAVAARVLVMDGMEPAGAVEHVRELREPIPGRTGGALTNQAFVDYLLVGARN
jgi:protein-tyrosine phosphatase